MVRVDALVRNEKVNAAAGWLLLCVVGLAALEGLLTDAVLWGGFVALVVAVAALPPLSAGEWTVMVPWPILLLAAVGAVTGSLGLYPEAAGYLTVSALALLLVIELDAFTQVDMTRRFAVAFAALTTMAVQGFWMVAQFYSDAWLGTEFLRSQTELQWDIVAASVVGIVVGAVFVWYFDHVDHAGSRGHPALASRES